MSDPFDTDIESALALSLGLPDPKDASLQASPGPTEIINLESDEESNHVQNQSCNTQKSEVVSSQQQSSQYGLLGLDRKQMEAERLARKRPHSISPPALSVARQKHAFVDVHESTGTSARKLQYPKGVVKKTWVYGHARLGDDIKLEEVLQKNDLQLAVLSAFQWDIEWVFRKLDMSKTRIVLIMQAKEPDIKTRYLQMMNELPNVRLCFPSMEGQINCMHSKLMLLAFPTHLRVAVPTANLVPYDWGETGEMENMVYLIDLPRIESKSSSQAQYRTSFRDELIYFLQAQKLDENIIQSLYRFDFSATSHIAFVHTIGGAHLGEAWRRTGHCGLGTAIKNLNMAVKAHDEMLIDFIASSVGSLDMEFLATIVRACMGDDGFGEFQSRCPSTGKGIKGLSNTVIRDIEAGFRLYFPTHETVKASTAGGAGTICMQSQYFDNPKFPRTVLRDCRSTRSGCLMHSKVIYFRSRSGQTAGAYIGSANCSQSAWGNKLVRDKNSKSPKLNCRNWECGVVIPVRSTSEHDAAIRSPSKPDNDTASSLDVFKDIIPVPISLPGKQYAGRKPWLFMQQT